jgi:asparagine synthase (glutamine-hydrolysing)
MTDLSQDVVQSFSIGFDSQGFNEAPFARKVAEHLGTRHYEEIIQPDPNLIIDEIGDLLDQPFADSSIIPTYLLSKFARQNTIVALGGDGGDEVFGGYDRYLAAPILQRFNKAFILSGFLQKGVKFTNSRKVRRLIENLEPKRNLVDRYSSIMSLVPESRVNEILHPNIRGNRISNSSQNHLLLEDLSNLNQMLKYDFESYLPSDLLVKADMGSMGNSLELRSPFLDFNLVEWGVSLPSKYKIANFETKHILKEIAREFIPRELIDRPKMGFAIPRAEWLRNELKPMTFDLLTDQTARNRQWFDQAEVRKVLSFHESGKDMDKFIWPMIMLEIWARKWLD